MSVTIFLLAVASCLTAAMLQRSAARRRSALEPGQPVRVYPRDGSQSYPALVMGLEYAAARVAGVEQQVTVIRICRPCLRQCGTLHGVGESHQVDADCIRITSARS